MWWLPHRGFAQYRFFNGLLVVYQLTGDMAFWYDLACLLCFNHNGRAVATICTLPIYPYFRLLHFKVKEEYEKNGQKRIIGEDRYGRKVVATYRSTDDTGTDTYWVTSYMFEPYGGKNG